MNARPGAIRSAMTVSPAGRLEARAPSTLSWPALLELMTLPEPALAHPGETAYQMGSPAESTSLSVPIVRHGKRPTAGKEHAAAVLPSVPLIALKLDGASGHGSAPGLFSPALFACAITYPITACFARAST